MGAVDTKMIKSARRVLEVLEFFDQEHATATVMDIARALGYPQSSTSELLRCLVALGYLHYNRYTRSYQPTARVALIGAWVEPDLFRDGALLPLIDDLSHRFGQTILLSAAAHYRLQHIHVVPGTVPDAPVIHVGDTDGLLHNVAGRLLLSTYQEIHIRSALRRLNAEEPDPSRRVSINEEIDALGQLRRVGWAIDTAGERSTLSIMLPPRPAGQRIVLSIVGDGSIIAARADEIRATVAQAHIGRAVIGGQQASNDDHHLPRSLRSMPHDPEGVIYA